MSDTESTGGYANEEFVERASEKVREQKQQRRQMSRLQQRVEQQLRSETVMLPVGGEGIEFQTFDRETSEWASILRERVRNLDGENYEEEFHHEVDRIYRVLGAQAEPEWMDKAWWEDHVSVRRAIQYIASINAEAEVSEEDVDQFRGE